MGQQAPLMAGKKGLVMGVANDRSLAWGITKAVSDHGAEVAFTYQNGSLEKRVRPLADSIDVWLRVTRLGYWTVPAGFMENGETTYQGAARVFTAIDEMLDVLINRTGTVGR